LHEQGRNSEKDEIEREKGGAEKIERREERSARRRARRKRAPGKGREKIPCMHSCNTLP